MYNNKVEMFQSNLIAKLFGYKTKTMFAAKVDEKNIKISFNKKTRYESIQQIYFNSRIKQHIN